MKNQIVPILVVSGLYIQFGENCTYNGREEAKVVFKGDTILNNFIPASVDAEDNVFDIMATMINKDHVSTYNKEDADELLIKNFMEENDVVENFWPEHGILLANDIYYRYSENNNICKFINEKDALNIIENNSICLSETPSDPPEVFKSSGPLQISSYTVNEALSPTFYDRDKNFGCSWGVYIAFGESTDDDFRKEVLLNLDKADVEKIERLEDNERMTIEEFQLGKPLNIDVRRVDGRLMCIFDGHGPFEVVV